MKYLIRTLSKMLFPILFAFLTIQVMAEDPPPPPPGGSVGDGSGKGGDVNVRNGATGAPIDRNTSALIAVLIISAGFGSYLLLKKEKATDGA